MKARLAWTTLALLVSLLSGCSTTSHVLVGTARPPISPDSVRVYLQPPPKYETVATIDASSKNSLALTGQQNMDKAIGRMKEKRPSSAQTASFCRACRTSNPAPSAPAWAAAATGAIRQSA